MTTCMIEEIQTDTRFDYTVTLKRKCFTFVSSRNSNTSSRANVQGKTFPFISISKRNMPAIGTITFLYVVYTYIPLVDASSLQVNIIFIKSFLGVLHQIFLIIRQVFQKSPAVLHMNGTRLPKNWCLLTCVDKGSLGCV